MSAHTQDGRPETPPCIGCGWESGQWTWEDEEDGETILCVECEKNRIPEGE